MNSFKPGKVWLDTDGNRIQAHAGYMFIEDGRFYWYGENKEKSNTEYEIWHWGVRLYSSDDLYNWKSEDIILPPELTDETSPVYFNAKMDRPHILYNEKTGLYVMWIKVMKPKIGGMATIATSRSIKGPFEVVKSDYLPNGCGFGDFDMIHDGERAYLIYEHPHSELNITPLTNDYMAVEEDNVRSYFRNGYPPFIREAPALFRRNGMWYMITSGTTGKFPNPSESAVSDGGIMGNWRVIGDPHQNDPKHTSFDSQISCIFKHPAKKDLYIAMADRWLVDLPDEMPDVCDMFHRIFNPALETPDFHTRYYTRKDTSIADYVWLPVEFEGDTPVIRWYDEWRWEDFD